MQKYPIFDRYLSTIPKIPKIAGLSKLDSIALIVQFDDSVL